ncbi:MAG: UvrD-helicase domain-containing protein [Candidatus Roizmanbacteria bacterium]|nr:MAG: UvrD-helicase domain-containing protein [Candidatus Roizmanbacteria bacterium]
MNSKISFDHLNKKQKEAVFNTTGPSVILAGAGSGKTRVLINKVVNLVVNHKTDTSLILMITFTNKAAAEMKERIYRVGAYGNTPVHSVAPVYLKLGYVGTFHSFCALALRRDGHHLGIDRNFVIYNDDDQSDLIKAILKKLESKKFTPSYFQNRISSAKNQLISPDRYLEVFSDYGASLAAEVYGKYQKELDKNQAIDFDDLIMKTCELFTKHSQVLEKYQDKYQFILVDEFQDTNYAQYVLTRLMGAKYRNVTVVGDFSQSIYSWRGADIRNLEKFSSDFPETKVFNLEQNYRSTQNILNFAYEVISKNQTHPILQLFTENNEGEEVCFCQMANEEEEAMFVANEIEKLNKDDDYKQFAVLYRTNAQSRAIEEAFLHCGIPYTLIGGTRFYERKEIKDILSYLRLLINPEDTVAADRIKKLGKGRWNKFRGFYDSVKDKIEDKNTPEIIELLFLETGYLELYNPAHEDDFMRLENIKELKSVAFSYPKLIEFLEQVALVESEYSEGEKRGKNKEGVRLMTLHQAKGLEFPYVFIVGVEEGILPHSRSAADVFQLEEERRLFYVGITRAREKLYITYAKRRFIFGRRNEAMKSRFIGGEDEDTERSSWY